jgi:hypothetical protein
MENQNYNNHSRYYVPHHLVFYPLTLALGVFCFYQGNKNPALKEIWWTLTAIMIMIVFLAFMVRQHYGLKNQDRIIRIEMRYRYFVVTGERFELLESKLTNSQIFALRFASDNELKDLVNKTLSENLTSKVIKQSIQNWQADNWRL